MANTNSQEEMTALAVRAALDFQSPADSRLAAVNYLESVKAGDVQLLGAISGALVRQRQWSSEVRHYGFKMLQHLVRVRWEELSPEQRAGLAEMVVDMISEMAVLEEEWVLKSQTAALVAEVARQEGPSLWQGTVFKLFDLSIRSPAHAELVAIVLRWLPEDVTVHNEDLEGERRRQLLIGLTQILPHILPFFYKMLQLHFGEALKLLQQGQSNVARQHAAVVTSSLNALLAYTEWAPVNDFATYGLIEACGCLLQAVDFRTGACEILKQVASRRRPTDDSHADFDSVVIHAFEALSHALGAAKNSILSENYEGNAEFTDCLCEAMAALGSQNLQCFSVFKEHLSIYLQQMLWLVQSERIATHYPALLLWLTLLRDMPSTTPVIQGASLMNGGSASGVGSLVVSQQAEKEKKGVTFVLSEDIYSVLLEVGFVWYLKRSNNKGMPLDGAQRDDEDLSSSGEFNNHRGRLLELVRFVAVQSPTLAVSKILQKTSESFRSTSPLPSKTTLLEGTQRLLENIIHAIFDGKIAFGDTFLPELQTNLEEILKVLLLAKLNDPVFVEIHGRHLDAIGPYLRISSAAALRVVEKIFELLVSLPITSKCPGQDTEAVAISRARLQVCTSFLRIAKAADKALSPHLEDIGKTVTKLQQQGLLLQGEHNLIAEAFLIIGSAEGSQRQIQVLDWFLGPLRDRWAQNSWQQLYLSSPASLVTLLTRETAKGRSNEEMWSLFHTITFLERALKRCGGQTEGIISMDSSSVPYPMMHHLSWMIPLILQLLRCIHSLWSPAFKYSLPSEVEGALLISAAEQAALIGEAGSKTLRDITSTGTGNDKITGAVTSLDEKECEIRNWLKGIRDSGYNVLGLAATNFSDSFFGYTDSFMVEAALLENLDAMEFRHIRQMLHSVIIPFVKFCPPSHWEKYLGKLLSPLLKHSEQVLSVSWANLIKEGSVKGPEMTNSGGLGLKTELMEEKMLRDLTRETCTLLAVLASPTLNSSLPSGEHLCQSNQTEQSGTGEPLQPGSGCLMSFLMLQRDIASASLSICNQALKWPDSEAVHKAIIFCGATVSVAAVFNFLDIQNFVARELLITVIQALTFESNAPAQVELVNLFRIIYLLLANRNEAPRQVLRSLPSITPDALAAFENALGKTCSAKEQKQHIKSLLLLAGGTQLKALTSQKNATVITNVSNRAMGSLRTLSQVEETDSIGLAAII